MPSTDSDQPTTGSASAELTWPSSTSSSFEELLDQVLAAESVAPEFAAALHGVKDVLGRVDPDRPFLTVLLRTQGRRIEPLKDALLCLSAQTDQDFEIVLIDHDADSVGAAGVRDAVAEQPDWFRSKIRIVEVTGGGRAKPLKAGVAAAEGRYIAVFDDDDLLFAHWVESFKTAAAATRGRLIRSVVANQTVVPEAWSAGRVGFRTVSWPKAEYPARFDQLDHLEVNYSPFMSWAFPRELFHLFGAAFDEELSVCEDWDLILRGSTLLGVTDTAELTAIYRRWEGASSSYTEHSRDSWRSSEQRVINKLDASILLLPHGTVSEVRELLLGRDARVQLAHLVHSPEWKLARPIRGASRVLRYGKRKAAGAVRRIKRLGSGS